jgi:hypothetical protein
LHLVAQKETASNVWLDCDVLHSHNVAKQSHPSVDPYALAFLRERLHKAAIKKGRIQFFGPAHALVQILAFALTDDSRLNAFGKRLNLGQPLAAASPTGFDDFTTTFGRDTCTESALADAFDFGGLIGWLHGRKILEKLGTE